MTRYRPDPESLAAHSVPSWWRDAKLGVMITWGLYSVAAFAPRAAPLRASVTRTDAEATPAREMPGRRHSSPM